LNLFKENGLLRYFLFLEILLCFSLAIAFLLSLLFPRNNPIDTSPSPYQHLVKNYRILRYFLNFHNPNNKIDQTGNYTGPSIMSVVNNDSPAPLDAAKRIALISELQKDNRWDYAFVEKKREELNLEILFSQKKYKLYIQHFKNYQGKNQLLNIYQIESLWQIKDKSAAVEHFIKLFQNAKFEPFRVTLQPTTLRFLMGQLDFDFWALKCRFLIEQNLYMEFLVEKKYIKHPQLVLLTTAEFYYLKRRYARCKRLLQQVKTGSLLNHKKRLLFKIRLRQNDFTDIMNQIDTFKTEPDIYYNLVLNSANILLIKGKINLSLIFFKKYLQAFSQEQTQTSFKFERSGGYWKSLWTAAWLFYQKKNYKWAKLLFQKGSQSPIVQYKIANSYWFKKMAETDPGELANYPYSYYYTKIDASSRNTKGLKHFLDLFNLPQSPRFCQIIIDLTHLTRYYSMEECIAFTQKVKDEPTLNESDKNLLKLIESILYYNDKNFYRAFDSFKNNFPHYHSFRMPRFLSHIYFPLEYRALIEKYSKQNNIDKMIIYAIIRNESFFNKNVMSPARACGLMQLVLQTARETSKRYGLKKNVRRRDLFDPEVNIQIGIAHFKYLLNRYEGKIYLALAAYNAGHYRAQQWLKTFNNRTEEEFIEMIPYSETRNYVKNILRNLFFYKFYSEVY